MFRVAQIFAAAAHRLAPPRLPVFRLPFVRRLLAACLAAGMLAACQSPGPVDNPVAQRLTWFSYLDGQDIRAACAPGTPSRLRLVYNGTWDSQVRSYDVMQTATGAEVEARVMGQDNVASVMVEGFNLLAPWDGQKSVERIDRDVFADLVGALLASGFRNPPPDGDWLRSDAYYWVAAACIDGAYHWNAWASNWSRGSPNYIARVRFVDYLLKADGTGVPYEPPQRQTLPPWGSRGFNAGGFTLQVDGDGLDIGPQF